MAIKPISRANIVLIAGFSDGFPVGAMGYVDTSWVGWNAWIERRSTGGTLVDQAVQPEGAEIAFLETGGFNLLLFGDFFTAGEIITVHFDDQLENVAPVPISSIDGISNGFNLLKVFAAFTDRLGWRQPTLSTFKPVLSADNLASASHRTYESFHAMSRLPPLLAAQPDPNISSDDFNSMLQYMEQDCITRCLNAVFCEPQMVEHDLIYSRISNIRQVVIPNTGNFAGYRIKVSDGDYACLLNKVAFFFDGVVSFNLYLFNDLTLLPLVTIPVTTMANSQTVVDLSLLINYISDNKGGLFYLGYFQDDLGDVHALDEQLNMWDDSKLYGAYPFQSPRVAGQLDFNRINPSVVFRSYGMSVEVSTYNDFTQRIIENASMFDEARGLLMAVMVIEEIRYSQRTNAQERIAAEVSKNLQMDVNLAAPGMQQPYVAGLNYRLEREFKRLYKTFFPAREPASVGIGADYDREAFAYDTFDIKNLPPRERFY